MMGEMGANVRAYLFEYFKALLGMSTRDRVELRALRQVVERVIGVGWPQSCVRKSPRA